MEIQYRKQLFGAIKPFFYSAFMIILVGIFTIPFENNGNDVGTPISQSDGLKYFDFIDGLLKYLYLYRDAVKDFPDTLLLVGDFLNKNEILTTNRYTLIGIVSTIVIAQVLILVDASNFTREGEAKSLASSVVRWRTFALATWILLTILGFLTLYFLIGDFDLIGFMVVFALALVLSTTLNFCQEKFEYVRNLFSRKIIEDNDKWVIFKVRSKSPQYILLAIIFIYLIPSLYLFFTGFPELEIFLYFCKTYLFVAYSSSCLLSAVLILWATMEVSDKGNYLNLKVRWWRFLGTLISLPALFFMIFLPLSLVASIEYLASDSESMGYLFNPGPALYIFFAEIVFVSIFVFAILGRHDFLGGAYREICLKNRLSTSDTPKMIRDIYLFGAILILTFSSSVLPFVGSGKLSYQLFIFIVSDFFGLIFLTLIQCSLKIAASNRVQNILGLFFVVNFSLLSTSFSSSFWVNLLCLVINFASGTIVVFGRWKIFYKMENYNSNFLSELEKSRFTALRAPWVYRN